MSPLGGALRRRRFSRRPGAGNGTDRGGGGVAPSGAVASDLANELREDDARYRAVVETAGDGIVSADADGVITSFNQAAERMFGYTRDEVVGRPLTILMPERFHDAHRGGLQRFVATGERHLIGRTVEVTAGRKDGAEFPLELSLASWEAEGRQFFTGVLRDTTDRTRIEQYFAVERAVLHVLSEASGTHEALGGALQALAEGTGWDLGDVWTIDEERAVLRCQSLWRSPAIEADAFRALTRQTTFRRGEGLPGRVWESCRPAWIADVQLDENFPRRPAAAEDGLHAAIALPLTSGGQFIGVLELLSQKRRPPDDELLNLLVVIAREVGYFVERKRTENSLRELATIVESTGDAIMGKSADGLITSWNAGAERLYGYTREEAVGQSVEILFPEGQARELQELLGRVHTGVRIERYETVRRRKDGSELDVSLTIAPVVGGNGHRTVAVAIAADISGQKRAERALAATAAELERSNAELERFGSIAAHDLSEPLRLISGFAELLRKRHAADLDEEGNQFLETIENASERMGQLVDDLLTYARVGRTTSREPVACGELVEQAVASLSVRIAESDARVIVAPLPVVHADASQLGQLFQNLISNALKFAGELVPEVRVSAERDEDAWRFSVADNGIGIEPRDAERIFDPFQRLHPRDAFPGTGIGLGICKRVVELHGGRIWAEPGSIEGTEFRFTIPDSPSPPAGRG